MDYISCGKENDDKANLALFIYVYTHCIETVKWLPGSIHGSGNSFYLLLCFYFSDQKHIIFQKGLQFYLQCLFI